MGKKVEHFNRSGRKTGESRVSKDYLRGQKRVEHFDRSGRKTGESRRTGYGTGPGYSGTGSSPSRIGKGCCCGLLLFITILVIGTVFVGFFAMVINYQQFSVPRFVDEVLQPLWELIIEILKLVFVIFFLWFMVSWVNELA